MQEEARINCYNRLKAIVESLTDCDAMGDGGSTLLSADEASDVHIYIRGLGSWAGADHRFFHGELRAQVGNMLSITYWLSCTLLLSSSVFAQSSLPQVDLGYEIHQAISFNQTGQTYNFSNIRYAQPPVGNLRFAAPVAPSGRNPVVQNGSIDRICPQAGPAWALISNQFLVSVLEGNASQFNYTQAEEELQAYLETASAPQLDPRTTEDCLFLDVIVPKAVFDNANNMRRKRQGAGAPVLIWIYGGGYTLGSKGSNGNPSGLIEASQAAGGDGIIYVALNYRLGALGWLAGPTLQEAGGASNAGLYDQRLAIEWVAKNIHLFGGDPNKITLIGESAGGGSIQHQITAFGGERGVSFQRAIPQSPGWFPTFSQFTQENVTQTFLSLLNVSTIADARNASSADVIRANSVQVGGASYGQFVYGPVVDGVFAPALPGVLLNAGRFAKNVSVMAGHNAQEGILFTPPYVDTDEELASYMRSSYPGVQPEVVQEITTNIYPAVYNGSYPYRNGLERTALVISESIFTCNTNYLARAFKNNTYNYEFQVPPAFHGFDIPYTFYNNQGSNLTAFLVAPVAETMQGYIVNFAMTGNPNGRGLPQFPIQGMNTSMQAIGASSIGPARDDTANPRCRWWQKALYT